MRLGIAASTITLLLLATALLVLTGEDTRVVAGGSGATDTITSPDTAGIVGLHTSLVLDGSGFPVVSYYDSTNETIKVLRCNDPNCAGGDDSSTSIDVVGNQTFGTSIALDGNGFPVVSYYDLTPGTLKVLHCNDPNCAGGDDSITSPEPVEFAGFDSSLVLDASGFPVISYLDPLNETLRVLHCNDPDCAGGDESITSHDAIGLFGGSPSLVLDGSGFPVVAYYDDVNKDLKVLHCNDPNCAGGDEVITAPDTDGIVGSNASLALDANGFPVVSYYDQNGDDLNLLHCNDANCAGGDDSITSPDTDGNFGQFTSLALDGNGYPVVSYFDSTKGNLKVLRCNDANCAGDDDSITSPDTDGTVGWFTSLALDGSGFPVISYYDVTNGDLKVLHCNDVNCAGGEITIGKLTTPGNDPQVFDFSGDLGPFSLSDDEILTFTDLLPGDYTVLEVLLPGWSMTGVGCGAADTEFTTAEGSAGTVIHLGDRENVMCIFNNAVEDVDPTLSPSPTATTTPTPTLASGETPAPTPTATSTPVPTGGPQLVQGDNDCDGDTDAVDALAGLRHVAGLGVNQQAGCPALGGAVPAGETPDVFGDVDCDGDVDSVDGLKVLRHVAALSVTQNEPCVDIGKSF